MSFLGPVPWADVAASTAAAGVTDAPAVGGRLFASCPPGLGPGRPGLNDGEQPWSDQNPKTANKIKRHTNSRAPLLSRGRGICVKSRELRPGQPRPVLV